ncbi:MULTISPECIES: hypothetical protein [Bradyrhizobium]|uniref:hypothetical protein n=1 Tax=Bradyrhizobium TaxID=374 RepID=UPI0003FB53DF|nr:MULTISPECIES: hypothetical protein [Bradyrhizobium]
MADAVDEDDKLFAHTAAAIAEAEQQRAKIRLGRPKSETGFVGCRKRCDKSAC